MNIRKDLFEIFHKNENRYDLYEKVINFIEISIEDAKGEENCEFWLLTNKLLNSINNAGWEERHSQQIQLLWDIQNKITNKYDKYLP